MILVLEIFRSAQTVYKKHGSLLRAWLTFIPFIAVLDPKYVQVILNSSKLSDKNFMYSFMHNFLGQGLITSSGRKSKSHRRYISSYFKTNYLEQFLQTFDKCARSMVEELKEKDKVQITTIVNHCILNILHQTIMGISPEEKEKLSESPFNKGQISLLQRILHPWLLLNCVYRRTTRSKLEFKQKLSLKEFSRKVLERRKKEREKHKTMDWCLLDGFIEISETKPDFTDEDIVDEVCTFMLAGQDSVGAATAFTLYYLAKFQDVQNKVNEEIKEVISNSNITIEKLDKMKYLERCICESLRICPSVPLVTRKLCEDVKVGEHVLPAGCNILISPFSTHRSPQYFPEPETFDPDRFCTQVHNCAYIPFSAGPRDCLGKRFAMLEMKTVISNLLQSYKVSLAPGNEQLQLQYRLTLRAKGGITLMLEKR
ncbi:hypothetical protein ILUMI_12566 [Ignelater luminosus]|uniref:Cytochrome P450 4aa1 n=1 Tax=Ignelater luminosus TaxID=2038154 RepID=A0A8K0CTW4_IGNLU|nr:hypothetical protein ILUMI_12566 [Ignelater luminosus]